MRTAASITTKHRVAIAVFLGACAILASINGGVGLFVVLAIIGFWPALMLYGWWLSLEGRTGARSLLTVAVIASFLFIVSQQQDAAIREAARRRRAAQAAQQYMAWYNSLSPHEKLQVDNAHLEEENARLRDQLNLRDR